MRRSSLLRRTSIVAGSSGAVVSSSKFHYLAAYTAALLNNQPMGFYSPATIVNDAKRHGLKVLPIDVQRSEWLCTLEQNKDADHKRSAGPSPSELASDSGFQISWSV